MISSSLMLGTTYYTGNCTVSLVIMWMLSDIITISFSLNLKAASRLPPLWIICCKQHIQFRSERMWLFAVNVSLCLTQVTLLPFLSTVKINVLQTEIQEIEVNVSICWLVNC